MFIILYFAIFVDELIERYRFYMQTFGIISSCTQFLFCVIGPISTTPEMPTAADMQLAAAVGSRGECVVINKAIRCKKLTTTGFN